MSRDKVAKKHMRSLAWLLLATCVACMAWAEEEGGTVNDWCPPVTPGSLPYGGNSILHDWTGTCTNASTKPWCCRRQTNFYKNGADPSDPIMPALFQWNADPGYCTPSPGSYQKGGSPQVRECIEGQPPGEGGGS